MINRGPENNKPAPGSQNNSVLKSYRLKAGLDVCIVIKEQKRAKKVHKSGVMTGPENENKRGPRN